ncbi:DUF2273 domain-containing protein [Fuchsiella alkaliacetigena]|uniref:DUF2273 domain-containing protein n=1 Tax=Fuchsiella alkaliacetigena TaxID=957042 RepID=UPI00200B11CD|nr:DUF2273 domain-containing protein [Fuchsiella alkaliacetigena]MCK8825448.1 DUF2273 domain-containing protein [Fuchsiella alkaliacetigena]
MEKEVLGKLLLLVYEYRGRIIGALLGFLISLLFIYFGFIITMFILVFVIAGYLLGQRYDEQGGNFKDIIDDILPPNR